MELDDFLDVMPNDKFERESNTEMVLSFFLMLVFVGIVVFIFWSL